MRRTDRRRRGVVLWGVALALGCAPTAPDAEPAPKPPPPPPVEAAPAPPGPTPYGDVLDAALGGPVPLAAELGQRWRLIQARAGDALPLLGEGDGLEPILSLLDFTHLLPEHGLEADEAIRAAADRLERLLLDLAAGRWTGDAATDRARMLSLIEAEHWLVHLWSNLAHLFHADRPHPPWRSEARQLQLLSALASWPTDALLRTLAPATASYDRLRTGLARYRALEADGGWVEVPPAVRRARPKRDHPGLVQLKARLAQEDPTYAPQSPPSPTWDEALSDALTRARAAYQLSTVRAPRKRVDKKLLRALDVPLEARLATIRHNLDRLRRSPASDHPFQVYVNIADYHGELRDGPTRLHRFRVVVGSSRGRPGRMKNATPTLTARIHRVVYNPWWVVPKRITREELVPKAAAYAAEHAGDAVAEGEEAPDYWRSHGYIVNDDGPEVGFVRRRPGWGNPLGKVKFLFENRHFVFLHDTPQKGKFRSTRRAFSHGCVRVEDPLTLAELLLTRDGTWDLVEEARVMSHHRETPIDLKASVPVVLDYLTARVDDDGRVRFLHDLYRRDPPQLAGR